MGRIRAGWALTKKSWAVLEGNRTLIRFPLYGAVATILMGIIVIGPGLYLIEKGSQAGGIALAIIGFYILAVIGFYFSVALAAAADMIFRGQQPTVGDGLDVARSRFGAIAGWAALSTVVGVILSILEEQGIVGQILGRLLDIGWSLLTFLAVPVIAIEGTGPIDTFKRSAGIFRSKWGQQLTGNLAIGGLVLLLGILPAGLLIVARNRAVVVKRLRRRAARDRRRDRRRDRAPDLEGALGDLRRRALPLRDRRRASRRLHRG